MTLTLDEVRRVRFRMARRGGQGYEVSDVDNFVDKVEESFNKMTNEAELLQRQIESLQSSAPASVFAPSNESEEIARLRGELDAVRGELDGVRAQNVDAAAGDQRAEQLAGDVQRLAAENERLRAELEQARAQRAQAAVSSDGPVERLVVTASAEASPAVVRLVQLATEQAEQVVSEADSEAKRKIADAEQRAFEITTDARTKADRVESEARVNAEKMTSDATHRASQIDREASERRTELFTALESERDDLRGKVDRLRGFESSFRENLTNHLQAQLSSLQNAMPEPTDVPELAARSQGDTPRLDALMGDQH